MRLRHGPPFVWEAIGGLPADAEPQRAYAAATAGFPADGVISPTVAVVREQGLAGRQDRLRELGRLLEAQPGVAAVFGPGDLPNDLEGLGDRPVIGTSPVAHAPSPGTSS